jgi:hypothetical protein
MLLAGAGLIGVLFVGCGDDGGGDLEAYCEASEDTNGVEEPSDEQLDALADNAPEEIADDVDLAVDQLKEFGVDIFDEGSDEFFEAIDRIRAFEDENCGSGDSSD